MHALRIVLTGILALSAILGSIIPAGAERGAAQIAAGSILESMSPEERVGQLFLITYEGSDALTDEDLRDLIENYHIGGVLITRDNDNLIESPDTLQQLQEQITFLQDLAYQKSLMSVTDGTPSQPSVDEYVPLFIALGEQLGGALYAQILEGMTEMPSSMSLGATWDPSLAEEAGALLGQELQALGINLYLGPSLDVVEEPSAASSENLGTRTFGGDPYWVGRMGEAFITGMHDGSEGRIGVVAGHFPGLGSSDRNIDEEVATIRKSLEQLRQIDLPPFLEVTADSPGNAAGIADGLLTSHIRYQGFQGNIRATTRPISLDSQAYSQLLALEPLGSWHENGGLLVSDSLGSTAIRRFIDPAQQVFQAHIVARDALLAGNDLLILDQFQAPNESSQADTIRQTLTFFAQKYAEDPLFALRVDTAVSRILTLKLRIYGNVFSPVRVTPSPLPERGASDLAIRVAQRSATLINPSQEELAERFSEPPQLGERIVFFTDVHPQSQCSTCARNGVLDVNAIEESILRFYGQEGARLVGAWNLQSFTFADLANYLGEPPPIGSMITVAPADDVASAIEAADWIIFSTLDSTADYYGANALKLFLDRSPGTARSKRTVAFAFDVPYALDATDISKLDVYYALYSSTLAYIDTAARLLFLEIAATGSPPVDVEGIGYSLLEVTSPTRLQVIGLGVRLLDEAVGSDEPPQFTIGDVVHLEAGPILDENGHIVPDGTVVTFDIEDPSTAGDTMILESTTSDGVASVDFLLDRVGLHIITASSDPALISEEVQLNVSQDAPAVATVISPTLVPTLTPPPTVTTQPGSPTTSPEASVEQGVPVAEEEILTPSSLLILVGCLGVLVGGGTFLTMQWAPIEGERVRINLLAALSGLIGYNYLALSMPGSRVLHTTLSGWEVPLLTLGAGVLGTLAYLGYTMWVRKN